MVVRYGKRWPAIFILSLTVLVAAGHVQAQRVAIVAAAHRRDLEPEFIDPQRKLMSTGRFDRVDIINASRLTPLLRDLQHYDAVLVWSNFQFANPDLLGNSLANYVDAGGGVVIAVFANTSSSEGYSLGGRWSPDYDVIVPRGGTQTGRATLGAILQPDHPLIANVEVFDGGTESFRPVGTELAPGCTLVAQWSDGRVLTAAGALPNRADLGMHPVSDDAEYRRYGRFWDPNTDGATLMANALEYVMGGPRNRLAITGDCPGQVTVSWRGMTPNVQQALIFGRHEGQNAIPDGQPCAGTMLGLSGVIRLVDPPGYFGTGPHGTGSIRRVAGSAVCDGRLQMVIGGECSTSNVVHIP